MEALWAFLSQVLSKETQRSCVWMAQQTYEWMPVSLEIHRIPVHVGQRGGYVGSFVALTTLTDAKTYPKGDIAQVYHYRRQAALDIRAIKRRPKEALLTKPCAQARAERLKQMGEKPAQTTLKSVVVPFPQPPRAATGFLNVYRKSWVSRRRGSTARGRTRIRAIIA